MRRPQHGRAEHLRDFLVAAIRKSEALRSAGKGHSGKGHCGRIDHHQLVSPTTGAYWIVILSRGIEALSSAALTSTFLTLIWTASDEGKVLAPSDTTVTSMVPTL